MSTAIVTKSDIISAITLYLASNERTNCPLSYLVEEKFSRLQKKQVIKLVNDLKKAGAIVGKRGRTGGLCFPETVAVEASPVESAETDTDTVENDVVEQDGMEIEELQG